MNEKEAKKFLEKIDNGEKLSESEYFIGVRKTWLLWVKLEIKFIGL